MDTLISLFEASVRYNLPEKELEAIVTSGKMVQMNYSGVTLVNTNDLEQHLPREQRPEYQQFLDLRGTQIGMREAAEKYGVSHQTISEWATAGYIARLGTQGRKSFVDEADVAYCAFIYRQKGGGQGKWLFARNGTPYTQKRRK